MLLELKVLTLSDKHADFDSENISMPSTEKKWVIHDRIQTTQTSSRRFGTNAAKVSVPRTVRNIGFVVPFTTVCTSLLCDQNPILLKTVHIFENKLLILPLKYP